MTDDSVTAWELLEKQQALEKVAAEKYPWNPDECTHHMGVQRQLLYACQTCQKANGKANAICYSCSIRCHTDHDLVELFSKRGITCDCGTTRIKGDPCFLRKIGELEKSDNAFYGHNFDNKFCVCDTEYNETEPGIMVQCLLGTQCQEDWFHERCILGLSIEEEKAARKAVLKPSDSSGVNLLDQLESAHNVEHSEASEEPSSVGSPEASDESESEAEDETLPGMPNTGDFDAFICWKCLASEDFSEIPGIRVDRVTWTSTDSAKRSKNVQTSLFLRNGYEKEISKLVESSPAVAFLVKKYPFLAEPEQTYEPPQDDDANSSIFEAGERALQNLPREYANNGIQAYSMMRDKLTKFLAPFASEGKVVTQGDVAKFFSSLD